MAIYGHAEYINIQAYLSHNRAYELMKIYVYRTIRMHQSRN